MIKIKHLNRSFLKGFLALLELNNIFILFLLTLHLRIHFSILKLIFLFQISNSSLLSVFPFTSKIIFNLLYFN